MKNNTVIENLVSFTDALHNSLKNENKEWEHRWRLRITKLLTKLPSGRGFDRTLVEDVTDRKVSFVTSFHHMNENGAYDGWTHHKVSAEATLVGLKVVVTGPNRNDIKAYIHDVFHDVLTAIDDTKYQVPGEAGFCDACACGLPTVDLEKIHTCLTPPVWIEPEWFEWNVNIQVHKTWVADGFELTDDKAHDIMARHLSYANGSEIKCKVTASPDAEDVAKTQGYKSAADRSRKKGI